MSKDFLVGSGQIIIKGAREHNLKNIDLSLPRNKMICITGLSGSGKSTLAFDTIYAEGQRRYVESLSSYARQFLGLMEKPDLDYIEGLSPAISIDQKSTSRNPRSTVATVTEIYDYLRLLFARIGKIYDHETGQELIRMSPTEIIESIYNQFLDKEIIITARIVDNKKGEHKQILGEIERAGYVRMRLDGEIMLTDSDILLDKNIKHSIDALVDKVMINSDNKQRLAESVEAALKLANGRISIILEDNSEHYFNENYATKDGKPSSFDFGKIEPRHFSFNAPQGACPNCTGLGYTSEIDEDLILASPRLSIEEGVIKPWSRNVSSNSWFIELLRSVGDKYGFTINQSIDSMSKEQVHIIMYGVEEKVPVSSKAGKIYMGHYEGVIPNLKRRFVETDSDFIRSEISKYMSQKICDHCHGKRLRPEILAIKIANYSIIDLVSQTVKDAKDIFDSLELSANEALIAKQILQEINSRLGFLIAVGLDYLTLDRAANTLAGGEAQRIRLATQIGSGLTGVLYVLDEPSIGLHQRDNDRLINTLRELKNKGNTVIVVEHDEDTIKAADWVVDIGPGAGEHGGEVIYSGVSGGLIKASGLTADYISGRKNIIVPAKRRPGNGKKISIIGASENNLKNIDVDIPLNTLTVVSGVSGSGKSTLVNGILSASLLRYYHLSTVTAGKHKEIKGIENLNKAIVIDQAPIGRTPRSNPVTYTGAFTEIRELFASTNEAKIRGYNAGRFSFNVRGGRCEACKGDGVIKIEMHFLPDVFVECEVCLGKRYNQQALEIFYKGKNIADILNMTVEEASKFFVSIPNLAKKLDTLERVGLGYIRLGQSATTLSGGEAQRIKLATELARRATGKTMYILDEPTTGLHFEDVSKLLQVLQELVDMGNSVLVIEHNLDIIKAADYVIDMGPEGGAGGGEVVATGTPEQISSNTNSITGRYLKL